MPKADRPSPVTPALNLETPPATADTLKCSACGRERQMGLSVMALASARQCGSCGAILSAPESEQPYVIEFAPDQRNHPEGESQ